MPMIYYGSVGSTKEDILLSPLCTSRRAAVAGNKGSAVGCSIRK